MNLDRKYELESDYDYINPGGKDFSLRVRINQKDKEKFYRICAKRGITPSKVLRNLVANFISDNIQYL